MWAMKEYYNQRRKRRLIIAGTAFIVVAVTIACIAAAVSNSSSKDSYSNNYAAQTEQSNDQEPGPRAAALMNFFGVTDAADVTWSHATNSKAKLDKALSDEKIMMIEADIIIDAVKQIPVMTYPPYTTSNLTLEEFLEHTLKHSEEKGIKLDFKQTKALIASIPLMKKAFEKKSKLPPIILNADILKGPNTEHYFREPVDPTVFFTKLASFKNAILSPGWTTDYVGEKMTVGYSDKNVEEMAKLIEKFPVQQELTFPIRGSLLALNPKPVHFLLNKLQKKTSITILSFKKDTFDPTKLGFLRYYTKRVFYDIPREYVKIIKESGSSANMPKRVVPNNAKQFIPPIP